MLDALLEDTDKMVIIALSFIFIIEAIVALILYNKAKTFITNSQALTAKINQLTPAPNGALTASVSFRTQSNASISTAVIVAKNTKIGDEIELLSLSASPEQVIVNNFWGRWFRPVIMAYSASIMLAFIAITHFVGLEKINQLF